MSRCACASIRPRSPIASCSTAIGSWWIPPTTAAISRLNDDEQLDLVALIWIGRGDFTLGEWDEAREAARDIGRARTPRYVIEIPLVSDYLDEALSQLGYSLEDYMETV